MPKPKKVATPVRSTKYRTHHLVLLALLILAISGAAIWKFSSTHTAVGAPVLPPSVTSAVKAPPEPTPKAMPATAEPMAVSETVTFAPTIPNKAMPTEKAPSNMVWIPGGEFSMGAQNPPDMEHDHVGMKATEDSRPIHRVYVDGFWMDKKIGRAHV